MQECLFLLPTDLLLRDCTSCVSWGGHTSRPPLVRTLTQSLHHVPERLELTHMWQQSSEFLSTHRYGLCLGPETRSLVWWQTSLSIFFCWVHLHRFKRVDGGGQVRGGGSSGFSTPPQEWRHGSASPRDGEALLFLLSVGWVCPPSAGQEWWRKDQIKGMCTGEHTILLPLFYFLYMSQLNLSH